MRLFDFDNTYAKELAGLYVSLTPEPFPKPGLLVFNDALARELDLDVERARSQAASIFAGAQLPDGAAPLAQAYAGHQFGHLSPQLGDGRAVLIGEILDVNGERRDIHLKGSGRTAFSRGGDGRATVGPVLREYLMGEAMHRLGLPTTRALAAVTTGENVQRDGLLPGAVLVRVASSHLRVGTFQFFAVRQDTPKLRRLTDYAIARHYPQHVGAENPAFELLREVAATQARLISLWMQIGFVHGVMNTDNVAISGETIDYGPCAFMESYDPQTVFSSIDHHGRYAYGNQPVIGKWNIVRFAEALLSLLADSPESAVALAEKAVARYDAEFQRHWLTGMGRKIGLSNTTEDDLPLVQRFLTLMEGDSADYTGSFRALAESLRGSDAAANALFPNQDAFSDWSSDWSARLEREPGTKHDIAEAMDRINPVSIPRNHKVEEALSAALDGDLKPFHTLLDVLADPFTNRPQYDAFAQPAPQSFGPYQTFCGT